MSDDALCKHCSPIPFYSLFTGRRYYSGTTEPHADPAELGNLQHIRTTTTCPLCRLVYHIISMGALWDNLCAICDPSDIQCTLWPCRMDYVEEMRFRDPKTKDLLATRLELRFVGLPHTSQKVQEDVRRYIPSEGILLLSPDSVDPTRPLMNGFQATTTERSLELLKGWIEGCQTHHGDTCCPDDLGRQTTALALQKLRAIDVENRQLVEIDAGTTRFAALSYVWGTQGTEYARLAAELDIKGDGVVQLPESTPKVIEDAIKVCNAVSVPYLWVDLYCVDQVDLTRKAAEIDAMGHIYRSAHVTLVAGGPGKELFASSDDKKHRQRIETIDNRKYITEATRIYDQIWCSEWIKRSWTYQEGHLARRIAYFDGYGNDVSFMCGAGHWRESLHSGVHGHDVVVPGVDLSASGFHVLGGHGWLRSDKWDFEEYERIALNYTRRRLSYESDKLAALAGCLRILEDRKGVPFVQGLPTADFHYALLWSGEDGPRREGFPSWSWAGWVTSMNVTHIAHPKSRISARIQLADDGTWLYEQTDADREMPIEIDGSITTGGAERPDNGTLCIQRLATIRVSNTLASLTIKSDACRFFYDVIPQDGCDDDLCKALNSADGLDPEKSYRNPWECLHLRDRSGNKYRSTALWLQRLPLFCERIPRNLGGSLISSLMRDGLELIKIVDIESVEGEDSDRFRYVLCLGIDRSEGVPGRGRRMGMFCIPGEYWEKAGPEPLVVELW